MQTKSESLKSWDVDLVLRTILEQVTWSLADVADNKWSRWLRDRKDSQLNIINYQSHHWQWSNVFVKYNSDFDDDSVTFAA